MAPNKRNILITESFVGSIFDGNFVPAVESDYLPLTAKEHLEQQRRGREGSSDSAFLTASGSCQSDGEEYWTWISDPNQEDASADIISADDIQALLIESNEKFERDHYWNESIYDSDSAHVKSKTNESDGYWEWSANPHHHHIVTAAHIQFVLEQKKSEDCPAESSNEARSQTSRDEYWDTTSAKDREDRLAINHVDDFDYYYYWNWPAGGSASTELVKCRVHMEVAGDVLSCIHVEESLMELARRNYWTFFHNDSDREGTAQSTSAGDCPVGYWDWRSSCPHENRQIPPIAGGGDPCARDYWTWLSH